MEFVTITILDICIGQKRKRQKIKSKKDGKIGRRIEKEKRNEKKKKFKEEKKKGSRVVHWLACLVANPH